MQITRDDPRQWLVLGNETLTSKWLDISVGFRTVRLAQLDQDPDDGIVGPYARSGMPLVAQYETGHELPQSHASIAGYKSKERQFGTAMHATVWGSIYQHDCDCRLFGS